MANGNNRVNISLTIDIHSMLWGLGDSKTPSLATAKAIEGVIRKNVNLLLQKANAVSKKNNSNKLDTNCILYVLRHNKSKLSRLLEFFSVQDTLVWNFMNSKKNEHFNVTFYGRPNRMYKITAVDYLSSIGVDVEESTKYNGIVMERKIRADRISRSLDFEDYIAFTKSRMCSFLTGFPNRRFIQWLQCNNDSVFNKLDDHTIDIIAYLTKDTIAELVDLVLFHRKNSSFNVNELLVPRGDMYSTFNLLMAKVDKVQEDLSPISPKEIRAAAIHL